MDLKYCKAIKASTVSRAFVLATGVIVPSVHFWWLNGVQIPKWQSRASKGHWATGSPTPATLTTAHDAIFPRPHIFINNLQIQVKGQRKKKSAIWYFSKLLMAKVKNKMQIGKQNVLGSILVARQFLWALLICVQSSESESHLDLCNNTNTQSHRSQQVKLRSSLKLHAMLHRNAVITSLQISLFCLASLSPTTPAKVKTIRTSLICLYAKLTPPRHMLLHQNKPSSVTVLVITQVCK